MSNFRVIIYHEMGYEDMAQVAILDASTNVIQDVGGAHRNPTEARNAANLVEQTLKFLDK
jgi:hypothetical protein